MVLRTSCASWRFWLRRRASNAKSGFWARVIARAWCVEGGAGLDGVLIGDGDGDVVGGVGCRSEEGGVLETSRRWRAAERVV